jgi:hypothetical protein
VTAKIEIVCAEIGRWAIGRTCRFRGLQGGSMTPATTGAHLWADRFDGSLEDVFDPSGQHCVCIRCQPARPAALRPGSGCHDRLSRPRRVAAGRSSHDREQELRDCFVEVWSIKMRGAYCEESPADAGARAEPQRSFGVLDCLAQVPVITGLH